MLETLQETVGVAEEDVARAAFRTVADVFQMTDDAGRDATVWKHHSGEPLIDSRCEQDVVEAIAKRAGAEAVSLASCAVARELLLRDVAIGDITMQKDTGAQPQKPRIPFEIGGLVLQVIQPNHESRVVVVVPEKKANLAARSAAHQCPQPIVGMRGEGLRRRLGRPFIVESVSREDKEVRFGSGLPDGRQVVLGSRSAAEQMQVGNESDPLGGMGGSHTFAEGSNLTEFRLRSSWPLAVESRSSGESNQTTCKLSQRCDINFLHDSVLKRRDLHD